MHFAWGNLTKVFYMYRTLVLATSFASTLTKAAERLVSLADKAAVKADSLSYRLEAKAFDVREQKIEDDLQAARDAQFRANLALRVANQRYSDARIALAADHPYFA